MVIIAHFLVFLRRRYLIRRPMCRGSRIFSFRLSPPLPAPVLPLVTVFFSVVIILFSLPFFLLRVDPNSIILLFWYC